MNYISTRGGIRPVPFKNAVMMGLATDGGLLLPEKLPTVSEQEALSWEKRLRRNALSYQDLALDVIARYTTDMPPTELRRLIDTSYLSFGHPDITPIRQLGDLYLLELFHGPTLAFKDLALQFLGNVFSYILRETGGRMNILGATSGDTGSAAIYGVRGKQRINIFIIHPHNRVSRIQELQMTTVPDPNVFNLAVQGTFDDGQAIVKSIFSDLDFKARYHLGAVNSINWARILAQVVYYVLGFLKVRLATGADQVDFAVPTGNFGDIFAGYVARRLLPEGSIGKLILATNENDLLARFVNNGDYSLGTVVATSSPSMDIQAASNFERYLYYLRDGDARRTARDMAEFAAGGRLSFTAPEQGKIRKVFEAKSVNQRQTLETIRAVYEKNDYILDPHSAVGVNAALSRRRPDIPTVCLATAHPAKFGDAVRKAIGKDPEMPPALAELTERESRCTVIPADAGAVRQFIAANAV